MSTQTIPIFFLKWLKQNTDHYRYQTEEARKLKTQIEQAGLESQEEAAAFSRYYMEFARLIEKNPLNGTDASGKDAAILAESFYYLFYPNNDGLYLPLQIYIEMGSISTPEKAKAMYDRMDQSLGDWIREAAQRKRQVKEEFHSGATQIAALYGKLLNRKISSVSFWVKQILLFCLILLSGLQIVAGIMNRIWETGDTVSTVSFLICSAFTVLFFIKSVIWICFEGKRKRLMLNWRHCVIHTSEKQAKIASGFRDASTFQELLKREILQAGSGPKKEPPKKEDLEGNLEDSVDYSVFLQKKNIRICNTIRPIHLFLMVLVFLCITMAAPGGVIRVLDRPLAMAGEEIQNRLDQWGMLVKVEKEMETSTMADVAGETGLLLETGDWTDLYTNYLVEYPEEVPTAGRLLHVLGDEYNYNTGELLYAVRTADGQQGYVKASEHRLREVQELAFGTVTLTDAQGNVKETSEPGLLADGYATTGCTLEKGDAVSISYAAACRFRYLYLINNPDGKPAGAGGAAEKLRIVFDDWREYYITLPSSGQSSGTYVRIPDVAASDVKIQVMELHGEETGAYLTELKLCGTRAG